MSVIQFTAQNEIQCVDCPILIKAGEPVIRTEHREFPDYKVKYIFHHLKCYLEKRRVSK